jgi:hypothetical protein
LPGDIVRIEPGEKHWRAASPQGAMTHIAIAEMRDGAAVVRMETVSDEQYGRGRKGWPGSRDLRRNGYPVSSLNPEC